ncbi:MAG: hypothetical protein H7338_19520 [Candidatus Sericytochromatia bacterium]|nr:hypothetical protein [Candidatus Sericytochromatia bacterium]
MKNHVLTMTGNQDVVFRKVSDLQRSYLSVLGELEKGHNVVMQRGDELVAVIIEPTRYNEMMRKASRAEDAERELAHMRTMVDLALAGGTSLVAARQEIADGKGILAADLLQDLTSGD